MPSQRNSFVSLAVVVAAFVGAACSRPATDTVLRCTAGDIEHVFRIPASLQEVEDLSATPPMHGQVRIADGTYVLNFEYRRDRYELVVVIDRTTGRGTRELFDDEQQLLRGHGGFDEIACVPDDRPR